MTLRPAPFIFSSSFSLDTKSSPRGLHSVEPPSHTTVATNSSHLIPQYVSTMSKPSSKRKREVQVVVCPTAFPDFTTVGGSTSRQRNAKRSNNHNGEAPHKLCGPELDVQETIREIHKFGSTGFTGKQQKEHEASEYERITGRQQKRQNIPTKILVGMRKKEKKREELRKAEMRESGVVHHIGNGGSGKKKRSSDSKKDSNELRPGEIRGVFGAKNSRNKGDRRKMSSKSFGPAPSVGFMKKGMLRVKDTR